MRYVFHLYMVKIVSKALWKHEAALSSPNGIHVSRNVSG